jgi:CubicO group peptidase (beta-lactamase class C family)
MYLGRFRCILDADGKKRPKKMKRKLLYAWIAVAWAALACCSAAANVFAYDGTHEASPTAAPPACSFVPSTGPQAGHPGYEGGPVIAAIEDVGNNAHETVEFTLHECTKVRIYAIGEGTRWGMEDWGAIENVATGQVLWQMYRFETELDGYSKNRRVERAISLPAGTYRLHFQTNGTHAFEDWGGMPPEHRFWGIALYQDVSPDGEPPVCWERPGRPEELGWSSRKLRRIVPELERMNCAALMIVTDGQVVYEWGNTANNFAAHSMRKSLLSALYGIYVAEGAIDPSKTLEELGIDDKIPLTKAEKQATVTDLLKARSGVYIPAAGEAPSMKAARPERGSHEHNTFWYYNNWDFNALGTLFDQETGEKDIYQAFKRRIADPVGMQDFAIENLRYTYEPDSMHPYYGFRISARDLARLGQLYLQGGQWEGDPIVPAEWVEESTHPHSLTGQPGTYSGYGYMWWIAAHDFGSIAKGSYAASGYGGHTVEVLPHLNTVIVFRINTDDPGVRLTNGGAVDQLVIKILKAFDRAPDPYRDARRSLSIWGALVAGSLAFLAWDMVRGTPASWGHRLAWTLIVAVFGPLGVLAYLVSYRQPGRSPGPQAATANWRRALGATAYGVAGYAAAMLLAIAYFVYVQPYAGLVTILVVSYAVPLIGELLVFRAPAVASQLGGRYWRAVRRSLLVETASANLAFAGMFPVILGLRHRWFPGPLEMANPLFWLMMLLATMAGVLNVYPLNAWMASRGFSSLPTLSPASRAAAQAEGAVGMPSWRDGWGALLSSVVLLTASLGLTMASLA